MMPMRPRNKANPAMIEEKFFTSPARLDRGAISKKFARITISAHTNATMIGPVVF